MELAKEQEEEDSFGTLNSMLWWERTQGERVVFWYILCCRLQLLHSSGFLKGLFLLLEITLFSWSVHSLCIRKWLLVIRSTNNIDSQHLKMQNWPYSLYLSYIQYLQCLSLVKVFFNESIYASVVEHDILNFITHGLSNFHITGIGGKT